jgi:signal-transduction protein with cAMP-binding, CBS, and nucleotidyltransferase domain
MAESGSTAISQPAAMPIPVTSPRERGTIKSLDHEGRFLPLIGSRPDAQPIRTGGNMIGKAVGSIVSDKKIQELIAVPASAMVSEAVSKMSDKGVGAILIKNSQNTVDGIFTERDLMIRVVNAGLDPKTTAIGKVMTAQVGRVEGWTSIEDALSLMVVHGYRHLLVEDAGNINGIVSIRDLMASMVIPETPMAHEGRAQVTRARAEAALRVVASAKKSAGPES